MVGVSIILASLIHNTPFRLRFAASRQSINELASAIERGEHPELPYRSGFFLVREVEGGPGRQVMLWTGGVGPGSPGRCGFVNGIAGRDHRYFWQSRMDEDWWFVVED